jgi:hypothetical protein
LHPFLLVLGDLFVSEGLRTVQVSLEPVGAHFNLLEQLGRPD